MSKTVKITCDACGKDITTTDDPPAYRLHLSWEQLEHTGNRVPALVTLLPPEDVYLCSNACFHKWVGRTWSDALKE